MNMVEKVAKAIYEERNGAGCSPWSTVGKSHKEPYRYDAHAAIEAMREPTKYMVESSPVWNDDARRYHIAMIDAALKEGKE